MLDGRRVYAQHVGERCDNEDCMGVWTRKELRLRQNKAERQGGFTENHTVTPMCVHFTHPRLALTLALHTFQVINKNKKRSKLCFFLHQRWCCSSLYTTILFFESVSYQFSLVVFLRSLNDSKSLQVSRILLSILVNLKNAVVWMV